jgi:hypothetical protein
LLQEITPEKLNNFVAQGVKSFSSEEKSLDEEVLQIINECLELVKSHVAKKRWKDEFTKLDSPPAEATGPVTLAEKAGFVE